MNAPNADTDTDHYSDIRIFDTSLRDGEQSPGCGMTPTQKLRLARALADLGVDVIEAGFPASSSADLQSVSAIAGLPEMPVVAALARCQRADIEAAARALQRARRPRIHVFISTSPLHREHKLGMSREAVLERAVQGVQWAREFVDDVEFSAEDALRTEPEFLADIYSATLAAGAVTLNVPDTVGYTTPDEIRALFEYLRANVRNAAQAVFSAHCHNDLGLAVANSLAAIEGGARQVECTINGIGERAGNCALEEIVMALRVRPERYRARTAIHSEQLVPTSRLLSRITGQHVPRNKAVVGLNAFAHEAGIHQHGMLRHRGTYEIMRPEDVGFTRSELVLGRHSGRHALADRIRNLGFELDDTRFEQVFHAFKTLGEKKREIFDVDLETLVLGQQPDASRGFRLARFHVTTGAGGHALPTASVEVVGADGRRITEAAPGDGPVHALFAALARATGIHFEVSGYQVTSISGGEDAQGQASVTALVEGEEWVGRSASTDILEASAQAWLEIANRYNRCVAPVAAAVNA